jgi:hypothetical protein
MPVSSDHHRREADRRFGPRFFATHRLLLPIERLPFPHATMVTSGPLEQCDPDKGLFRFSGISKNEIGNFLLCRPSDPGKYEKKEKGDEKQ